MFTTWPPSLKKVRLESSSSHNATRKFLHDTFLKIDIFNQLKLFECGFNYDEKQDLDNLLSKLKSQSNETQDFFIEDLRTLKNFLFIAAEELKTHLEKKAYIPEADLSEIKKAQQSVKETLKVINKYEELFVETFSPQVKFEELNTANKSSLEKLKPFIFNSAKTDLTTALWLLQQDEQARRNPKNYELQHYKLSKEEHEEILKAHQSSLAVQTYYARNQKKDLVNADTANPKVGKFKCRAILAKYENRKNEPLNVEETEALKQILFGDVLLKTLEKASKERSKYLEQNGYVINHHYFEIKPDFTLELPESKSFKRLSKARQKIKEHKIECASLLVNTHQQPDDATKTFKEKGAYCIGEHSVPKDDDVILIGTGVETFFSDFLRNGNKQIDGEAFPHFLKWLADKSQKDQSNEGLKRINQWLSEKQLTPSDLLNEKNARSLLGEKFGFGTGPQLRLFLDLFVEWLKSEHSFTDKHITTFKHYYTQFLENPLRDVIYSNFINESNVTYRCFLEDSSSINYSVQDGKLLCRGIQTVKSYRFMTDSGIITLTLPGISITEIEATEVGFKVNRVMSNDEIHFDIVTQKKTFYDLEFTVKVLKNPNLKTAQENLGEVLKRALSSDFKIDSLIQDRNFGFNETEKQQLRNIKELLDKSDKYLHLLALEELKVLLISAQSKAETGEWQESIAYRLQILNAYVNTLLQKPELGGEVLQKPFIKEAMQAISPFSFAMQSEHKVLRFLRLDDEARRHPNNQYLQRFRLQPSEHDRLLIQYQSSLAVQTHYANVADIEAFGFSSESCDPVIEANGEKIATRPCLAKLMRQEKLTPAETKALNQIIFGDGLLEDLTEEETAEQKSKNVKYALANYSIEKLAEIFEINKDLATTALKAALKRDDLPEAETTAELLKACKELLPKTDSLAQPDLALSKQYRWQASKNSCEEDKDSSYGSYALLRDWQGSKSMFIIIDDIPLTYKDFVTWYDAWDKDPKPNELSLDSMKAFLTHKLTEKEYEAATIETILTKIDASYSQGFIGRESEDSSIKSLSFHGGLGIGGKIKKFSLSLKKDGSVTFIEEQNLSFVGAVTPIFEGNLDVPGQATCQGEFTEAGAQIHAAGASNRFVADLVLPEPKPTIEAEAELDFEKPTYKNLIFKGESAKDAAVRLASTAQLLHENLQAAEIRYQQTLTEDKHRYYLDRYGFNYFLMRINPVIFPNIDTNLLKCLHKSEIKSFFQYQSVCLAVEQQAKNAAIDNLDVFSETEFHKHCSIKEEFGQQLLTIKTQRPAVIETKLALPKVMQATQQQLLKGLSKIKDASITLHRYFLDKPEYGLSYFKKQLIDHINNKTIDKALFAALNHQEVNQIVNGYGGIRQLIGRYWNLNDEARDAILGNAALATAVLKAPKTFGLEKNALPSYDDLSKLNPNNWQYQYQLAKAHNKAMPASFDGASKGLFSMKITVKNLEAIETEPENLAVVWRKNSKLFSDNSKEFWEMMRQLTDKELIKLLPKLKAGDIQQALKRGIQQDYFDNVSSEKSPKEKALDYLVRRIRLNPKLAKALYDKLAKDVNKDSQLQAIVNLASLETTGQLAAKLLSKFSLLNPSSWTTLPAVGTIRKGMTVEQKQQMLYCHQNKQNIRQVYQSYQGGDIQTDVTKGAQSIRKNNPLEISSQRAIMQALPEDESLMSAEENATELKRLIGTSDNLENIRKILSAPDAKDVIQQFQAPDDILLLYSFIVSQPTLEAKLKLLSDDQIKTMFKSKKSKSLEAVYETKHFQGLFEQNRPLFIEISLSIIKNCTSIKSTIQSAKKMISHWKHQEQAKLAFLEVLKLKTGTAQEQENLSTFEETLQSINKIE